MKPCNMLNIHETVPKHSEEKALGNPSQQHVGWSIGLQLRATMEFGDRALAVARSLTGAIHFSAAQCFVEVFP